jgi:hypothetical protein
MPQPQKFFRSDPENKGRGAGFYYRRHVNGRPAFSKYSGGKDANYKYKNATPQPKLPARYDHAGDRSHKKKTFHAVRTSPKKSKTFLGWF